MKRRRRTEITIETRKVTLIHQRSMNSAPAWCVDCAAAVEMLHPEQAAALTGSDTRTLYREIEAGRLHFQALADGRLLICLPSLLNTNHTKENSL